MVHARNLRHLQRSVRLVAVADVVPSAANSLAAECGVEVRRVEEIVEGDDIDAVVICTPTDSHAQFIQMAAKAGKAIFCEKPVDTTVEGSRECAVAVKEAGVGFMVGFQRRYDPNFAQVEARIREGDIGDIETVSIVSRDPEPPLLDYVRRSGGLFRDMMIHDFDMARFLLNEEPISVYAAGSVLVDPMIGEAGDVDTASVTLATSTGKICQILCSRRSTYGYDQRVEVHGAKGMLRAGNLLETSVEMASREGFRHAPAQRFFIERYQAAYLAEIKAFVTAVETGHQPKPSMEDGLRAQKLADAATNAWEDGRPMVLGIA